MGRGTLPEFRDGSGNSQKGQERVGVHSRRSGTGREVLLGVRNWSGDPPRSLERLGGPSEGPVQVEGPSRRFGTGRRTLMEVWDVLGDPTGGPGRVGVTSWRSRTGRGTFPEV